MDTRTKIVEAAVAEKRMGEWLAAGAAVDLVVGTFDPLLAAHAKDLEAAVRPGARVVVMLLNRAQSAMPRKDRLELVAALRIVDLVIGDGVPQPPPQARVLDMRETHEQRAASFVEYVRQRNKA